MYPWEVELPAIAALSDQEAADAINAMTTIEVHTRFGSLRTIASLLSAEEYAALRAALDGAAEVSPLLADMLAMLKLPGDELGNGGGIDFGNASVRATLDQLAPPAVAEKLKAYAIRTMQKYPWAYAGQVAEARKGM